MSVLRWLGCLPVVAAAIAVGCAEGDSILADGSGGTSDDGAGGSTQTATVTTGPTCVEDPCKLVVPQCGCGDQQCTIDGAGDRACVTAGTVGQSQECSDTALCEPGTICVEFAAGFANCAKFCDTDAQCEAPGGACVFKLDDGNGGDVVGVTMCSENCDLATNQGCGVAGTSCQLGLTMDDAPFTVCRPSGTLVYQEICTETSECSPDFVCLPTTVPDERCFQWCKIGGSACPTGQICTAQEISAGVPLVIGTTTYGICNPE